MSPKKKQDHICELSMAESGGDLSTVIFYALLLVSNMVGSGFFNLWIVIEDLDHPLRNLMKIGGVCYFSLHCLALFLSLLDKYKKDNYLDLVEAMTSPYCAKMAAFLFFVAHVMSLASLIATSKKKMEELTLMFKELDEDEQELCDVTSFIIACSFIIITSHTTKPTSYQAYRKSASNIFNTVNVNSSNVGSVVINDSQSCTEPERNGRQGIARLLGRCRSLVMLLLLFAYIVLLVIGPVDGPFWQRRTSLESRSSWNAMPTLIFATSTLAFMVNISKEGRQRFLARVRSWNTWIAVGILTCIIYFTVTLIFSSRYGSTYDEDRSAQIMIVLCVLSIIICTVAASLRLEPVFAVYNRVVPHNLQEITQHGALCYNGFLFSASALVAFFVADDVETIIAYCGCTVLPFLMWFVPHGLSVVDLWRHQELNVSERFSKFKHILILIGIVVFIIAHFAGISSRKLPLS